MGTTDKVQMLRVKRRVYQVQKTKEYKRRIAKHLPDEEKKILYNGEGFVRVPDEETRREKIDAYPYLIL